MRRIQFYILIGLIWAALIVRAIFSYDYITDAVAKGYGCAVTDGGHEGFSNLPCNVDYLIAELASSVFWGILATVVLYSLIDIEDEEE